MVGGLSTKVLSPDIKIKASGEAKLKAVGPLNLAIASRGSGKAKHDKVAK